jgi:hypothetical protein
MADRGNNTNNFPELFVGMYERLTGKNAEITYAFDDFEVDVPASTDVDSPSAHWKVNGALRISARENRK